MKAIVILAAVILLSACESLDSVPQRAAEVNFEPSAVDNTRLARSEEIAFFRGVDIRTAYSAGKEGLEAAGFAIKRESFERKAIVGEHQITLLDWNIVAGVYLKEQQDGTVAKVVVQRSKDLGWSNYKTGGNWPKRILMGMRIYILESRTE